MGNAGYGNYTEDTKNYVDSERPDPQAGRMGSTQNKPGNLPPAAGPHDKPSLTNPDSTPGTGTLPEPGNSEDSDSTSS